MIFRLLLSLLFLLKGALGAPAAQNSAVLWMEIIVDSPSEATSLCQSYLYGVPATVTVFKTATNNQIVTTAVQDRTKTNLQTISHTSTTYTTVDKFVTTIVTNGITQTKTVSYVLFCFAH
jgi:hypothetical protein